MTVKELSALLAEGGIEDPLTEARLMVGRFGHASEADLFLGCAEAGGGEFESAVHRRLSGEPLAYIFGEWAFYRETYLVSPAVLIPRQDTEILVEEARKRCLKGARFLDLCTGSGCVVLSTLAHSPAAAAVAVDLSEDALAVAKENSRRLGLSDRVTFLKSDVLTETIPGKFDFILSNPPYVDDAVYPTLQREIAFEPKMAFVGGPDGMDFYRAILAHYRDSLNPDGFFAFEIGYDQREKISALAKEAGFTVTVIKDCGGCDRVAILTR